MKANTLQDTGVYYYNATKLSAVGALFFCRSTNRFLFVQRDDKKHRGKWGLVGGKIEINESSMQALSREMEEEIGFIPHIEKIIPLEIFTSDNYEFNYSTFVCVIDSEFIPKLNHEHKGYAWTEIDNIPKPLHPGFFATLKTDVIKEKIDTILKTN